MAGSSKGIAALETKLNASEPFRSCGNRVAMLTATSACCPVARGKVVKTIEGKGRTTVVTSNAESFAAFMSPSTDTETVWLTLVAALLPTETMREKLDDSFAASAVEFVHLTI